MKGIFGLIGFLCLCVFIGSVLLSREVVRDPGRQLAVAYGVPMGDEIQVHLAVPPRVPMIDARDKDPEKVLTWSEWVDLHFQLRHTDGTQVPLRRMGTSALMLDQRAAGAPEFVVWAEVKKGEDYEFDFMPIMAEAKAYRLEFTAPMDEKKVGRPTFALVTE